MTPSQAKETYNGEEYTYVCVRYKDCGASFNAFIEMSNGLADEKLDDIIFFFVNGIDQLVGLTEEDNGEDFVVEEIIDFVTNL